MPSRAVELFNDAPLIQKVREKLPSLFDLAEIESSRDGKVGMEVGSKREQIITALLMYKFGEENVTRGPINEADVDLHLFGDPISIKSFTTKPGGTVPGIKVIWTVDSEKVQSFLNTYTPVSDLILAHVVWDGDGGLLMIPSDLQQESYDKLGSETYLKAPKPGTNPRGVEISKEALRLMLSNEERVKKIPIHWTRPRERFDSIRRWLDYWER